MKLVFLGSQYFEVQTRARICSEGSLLQKALLNRNILHIVKRVPSPKVASKYPTGCGIDVVLDSQDAHFRAQVKSLILLSEDGGAPVVLAGALLMTTLLIKPLESSI